MSMTPQYSPRFPSTIAETLIIVLIGVSLRPSGRGLVSHMIPSGSTTSKQAAHLSHGRPVHLQKAPSLLSRHLRATISGSTTRSATEPGTRRLQDFAGFKHLLMMVLFIGNLRLFCFDAAQFGFWRALQNAGLSKPDLVRTVVVLGVNSLYIPLALVIEKLAVSQILGDGVVVIAHTLNVIACLVFGSWYTYGHIWHPLVGTISEANTIVTHLKLVSFALSNHDLRLAWRRNLPVVPLYASCPYPQNLTLKNTVYFWWAPTLVYQPVYPQTNRVRWSTVGSLVVEITTGLVCIWFLAMQMASLILERTLEDYRKGLWSGLFDDFLSLASVNICIWLIGFFVFFQSMLNFFAELTRFADRDFYQDWWNAGCVGTFWRDWNRPVSNMFRRHLYLPLRRRGWSSFTASNAVFFWSAVLHELLVGVPTHNFNGVAFLCMMAQTPLILVTAPLERMRGPGTKVGNCVFWTSILFGMPTAIVIYYLAWHLKQRP